MGEAVYSPSKAVGGVAESCRRANFPEANTNGVLLADCCKKSLKEIENALMTRQVLVGTDMLGAFEKVKPSGGKSFWEALFSGLHKSHSIASEDWKEAAETTKTLSAHHVNAIKPIVSFEIDQHEYFRTELKTFWQCIGRAFGG